MIVYRKGNWRERSAIVSHWIIFFPFWNFYCILCWQVCWEQALLCMLTGVGIGKTFLECYLAMSTNATNMHMFYLAMIILQIYSHICVCCKYWTQLNIISQGLVKSNSIYPFQCAYSIQRQTLKQKAKHIQSIYIVTLNPNFQGSLGLCLLCWHFIQ